MTARSELRNPVRANREIAFTDGLIDRGVYRLCGLSEHEVTVLEEAQTHLLPTTVFQSQAV